MGTISCVGGDGNGERGALGRRQIRSAPLPLHSRAAAPGRPLPLWEKPGTCREQAGLLLGFLVLGRRHGSWSGY
jgi:hypothetical protein